MINREKVLKGLECCCQMNGAVCRTECPYRDECIKNECVGTAHLCANALELLKENDIELERIHQNICAYINSGCSTDTEADKEYVCSQIDQIFEGKPLLLDEEADGL